MGSDVLCKLENVFLEGFYVRHGVCVCVEKLAANESRSDGMCTCVRSNGAQITAVFISAQKLHRNDPALAP